MTSVVLKTLSVLLGLFFVFVGVMKVAPYISRELHKDLTYGVFLGEPWYNTFCPECHKFTVATVNLCHSGQKLLHQGSQWKTPLALRKQYLISSQSPCSLKRKDYVKYAKVFPLAQTLVFKVSPKWYRRTVGGLEILCGLILTLIPYAKAKQVANVILIILMIGAVYSHYMVDDRFERMAPALVFFFMLTCRLVVDWQLSREIALKAPIVEAKSEKTE